jgi:hypothetical protein
MAMLAAIGDLPDTIMDRAIVIRMRRRAPGEKVSPFRTRRDAPPLKVLRDQLHESVRGNLDSLRDAVPDLPVEDRAADTWEPLFAVVDLAGGDWPRRVRTACLALSGEEPDDARMGTSFSPTSKRSGVPTRSTFSPRRSSSGSARWKKLRGQSGDANANRSRSAGLPNCYGRLRLRTRRFRRPAFHLGARGTA